MNTALKFLVYLFVPHSLAELRWKYGSRARSSKAEQALRERNRAVGALAATTPGGTRFAFDSAIQFLVNRQISEQEIRGGAISETALEFCVAELRRQFSSDRPVRILHIGNFLGVSLAYLADAARTLHLDSCVVAVDPNISHRGIDNPESHVVALLNHFGLQRNVLLIKGFSLHKNLGNDGGTFYGLDEDPVDRFAKEQSCECVLNNLRLIGKGSFDAALIDGNHDPEYLSAEIDCIRDLLGDGGLLMLDDVSESWVGIEKLFHSLSQDGGLEKLSHFERVGLLRKRARA